MKSSRTTRRSRYLQQQYGLDDGRDHGRVWRLVHDGMPEPQSPNLAKLNNASLGRELFSDRFWRRQTARRLLTERHEAKPIEPLPRGQADRKLEGHRRDGKRAVHTQAID